MTYDNDISLLKLSAPVNFTDYISPVCLASQGSNFLPRTNSMVTGWGVTSNGKLAECTSRKTLQFVFI